MTRTALAMPDKYERIFEALRSMTAAELAVFLARFEYEFCGGRRR